MARISLDLITIIRTAAQKIEASNHYQWGHMGLCNCGYLAQEVTRLSKEEIHRRAMMRHGDWSEQLNDYCFSSGIPMDDLISDLISAGFDSEDLKNLERLADQHVLRSLPANERDLHFNVKQDVVKYMNAWAALLEEELMDATVIPSLELPPAVQVAY